MTPHEKALEAATDMLEQFGLSNAIKTYLTTLLDSPDMVEKIARAMMQNVFRDADPDTAPLDWTGNDIWGCDFGEMAGYVIAAIKKEAGI
jgi:hypothetical protein